MHEGPTKIDREKLVSEDLPILSFERCETAAKALAINVNPYTLSEALKIREINLFESAFLDPRIVGLMVRDVHRERFHSYATFRIAYNALRVRGETDINREKLAKEVGATYQDIATLLHSGTQLGKDIGLKFKIRGSGRKRNGPTRKKTAEKKDTVERLLGEYVEAITHVLKDAEPDGLSIEHITPEVILQYLRVRLSKTNYTIDTVRLFLHQHSDLIRQTMERYYRLN